MIVSKRKPRVEAETDYVALYDRHFQNEIDSGSSTAAADLKAFGLTSIQWTQDHPMHADYLPMGNKGQCCFCGGKGADMPVTILGTGVSAHSGPGRQGKYEIEAKREASCWDAVVWQLSAMARAGLAAEGLQVGPAMEVLMIERASEMVAAE